MQVTMLLCDAAQTLGGKLYVLGGGWSVLFQPNVPTRMSIAVVVSVPWNQANEQHSLSLVLLTEDGEAVQVDDEAVSLNGKFEVGRPPGLKPGTDIDAPFVADFTLALDAGGYVWELSVDATEMARRPFRVLSQD
jgi:hypothetical protein